MTPFEAGLGRFVDLKKPIFVGRDSLTLADRHAVLYGLSGSSTPGPGSGMRLNDSVVGRVTAGAWSPFLERGIGYVRMAEPGEWVGSKVRVKTTSHSMCLRSRSTTPSARSRADWSRERAH